MYQDLHTYVDILMKGPKSNRIKTTFINIYVCLLCASIAEHFVYFESGDSLVTQMVKSLPVMWKTLILRSRWSPGEGNGNPLQCSCLENPMDGGDIPVKGSKSNRIITAFFNICVCLPCASTALSAMFNSC